MANKPIITIGIPTCYGGESLITTVASIQKCSGNFTLEIIIQADRTPISKRVRNELKKLGVQLYWNDKEGSQFKKLNQIIRRAKGEIFIFTQDDIIFDPRALCEICKTFINNPAVTMLCTRVLPLPTQNFFESGMASMVRIVDRTGREWNNGDNHLVASGRCMAFRSAFLRKYSMPETIVTGDVYLYLENRRLGGKFTYTQNGMVYIRCPQNLKDQMGPSSRYQYSEKELQKYFRDAKKEYQIPQGILIKNYILEFITYPISTLFYMAIYCYTRLNRYSYSSAVNPVWKVDLTTKNVGTTHI